MPTFAAFLGDDVIDDRRDPGLIDAAEAHARKRARVVRELESALLRNWFLAGKANGTACLLEASLAWMGRSPAWRAVAAMEGLRGEYRPQKPPGSATERPNWKRKTVYNSETITRMSSVLRVPVRLDRWRGRQETR